MVGAHWSPEERAGSGSRRRDCSATGGPESPSWTASADPPGPPPPPSTRSRWSPTSATPVDVAAAVSEAVRALGGPVDVCVNAAGVYRIAPLLELAPAEWDDVLAINLRGTFLVGREVVRGARRRRACAGAIVNISSTAGLVADASEPGAHYNASKAGVLALTRQMAAEWAPLRHPRERGLPGRDRHADAAPHGRSRRRCRLPADRRCPLGRLGAADEVAAAIAFLASDDASLRDRRRRARGRRRNRDLRSRPATLNPSSRTCAVEGGRARARPPLRRAGRATASGARSRPTGRSSPTTPGWDWATGAPRGARYATPSPRSGPRTSRRSRASPRGRACDPERRAGDQRPHRGDVRRQGARRRRARRQAHVPHECSAFAVLPLAER